MSGDAWRQWLAPSVWLAAIAGLALLGIVALMTAEGVLRAFFGTSVQGATEINEVLLAVSVLGVLPLVMASGPHIRVDLVYELVAPRFRVFFDALGHAAVATFLLGATWSAAPWAYDAWQRGDVTQGVVQVPVYPLKLLLLAVTASAGVQQVVTLLRAARRGRRRP